MMKKRLFALIAMLTILCLFSTPVRADVSETAPPDVSQKETVLEAEDESVLTEAEVTEAEKAEVTEAAETTAEETKETEAETEAETAAEAVEAAETETAAAAEETVTETAESDESTTAAETAAAEDLAVVGNNMVIYRGLVYRILSDNDNKVTLIGAEEPGALTEVTIPESIPSEVGEFIVTEIEEGAFAGDQAVQGLTISSTVVLIRAEAFSNCIKLKEINFAEDSHLQQIGANAFAYTGKDSKTVPATIANLTLPASLEVLEDGAFHCIPVEVFALEDGSLLEDIPCGFLSADGRDGYPGERTQGRGFFDFIHFILFESDSFTPEKVAEACDCLKSVDFGDNNHLKMIGMGAFKNQTHLTSIDFGKNPAAEELIICNGVFVAAGSQTGIDTVVFPSNLKAIGYGTPSGSSQGASGSFIYANIRHIVFSDGCPLEVIPEGFMEIPETGNNGRPGDNYDFNKRTHNYVYDRAQVAGNSLESIDFGENNHIKVIERGAFKNQSHLKSIDFGSSDVDLTIRCGAFIGAGNNGYLVQNGIDTEINEGIENLTLPANLTEMEYGAFDEAKVIHFALADNSRLKEIPNHFMGMSNEGCNGYPGKHREWKEGLSWYDPDAQVYTFVYDQEQIEANSLKTISFGKNNSLTRIGYGAFYNQSHLTSIDFGTPSADALVIWDGAFIGAGNNGYLYEQKVDAELNEGIDTLVLPACVTFTSPNYSYPCRGMFELAKIKNLVISDNSILSQIPDGFLNVNGFGNNGHPGMKRAQERDSFVLDYVQLEANSLETIRFGKDNSLKYVGPGAFYNQGHVKVLDFGTSKAPEMTFDDGAFVGVGNNGYLVDMGIDSSLNEGITNLTLPANLTMIETGTFDYARIKNLVFADNCKLQIIPYNFLGICGEGNNGHPGQDKDGNFVKDLAQIGANALETVKFGANNSLTIISNGAFRNQSHMTSIDFGTSDADLSIQSGSFIGIGNNRYLYENKADASLNKGIETLRLPANLKTLDCGAFGFAGIRNLVFDGGMKFSGLEAGSFQDLDLMETLVLGKDFTAARLDGGAFSKCDVLTAIDLRDTGITNIDDAIKENAVLTTIVFPEKLESITWTYTEGMTEEERAGVCPFYGCGNVNALYFTNTDPSGLSFDQGVFQFLNEAGTVFVPADTTDEQIEAYRAKLVGAGLNIDEKDHWHLKKTTWATRVYGNTRYKTSIAVANELKSVLGVDKFDTICIATGENPVDALAGSYVSVNLKAPILMIQNKKTPIKLVTDYVKENLAKGGKIIVFGGENAIPEACLEGLKGYDIQRAAGSTRWRTNIMLNEIIGVKEGEEVLICDGIGEKDANGVEEYAYADSLSASASGKPMLLVDGSAKDLKSYQKEYLQMLVKKNCKFVILGGEKAVSNEMKAAIEAITGTKIERVAGSTRYRTSAALAEKFFPNARAMVLATGENFPDGLCGGALAAALGGPVFLVKETATPKTLAKDFAKAHQVTEAIVLGGPKAITDDSVREVYDLGTSYQIIVHAVK